jgi:hypothetical protein
MISLASPNNSFLTFDNKNYITDSDCGIVKSWCFPVVSDGDIKFQFTATSDVPIGFDVLKFLVGIETQTASYVPATVNTDVEVIDITSAYVQMNFTDTGIFDNLVDGDCFTIKVYYQFGDEPPLPAPTLLGTIQQCFQFIADDCFTSKLIYLNNEDAFGFVYPANWANIIRLPIYFKNPTIEAEQKVYVRSNGTRQLLSSRLSKTYLGLVDHSPEEVHQNIVVALSHDSVNFVTDNNYYLTCTFENEYNNEFNPDPLPINIWPASFTVYETPFDNVNSNCG